MKVGKVSSPARARARDASVDPAVVAVGSRVRELRDARGLSLRDLAARCGVSAPMLSQVERGETSPTLAVASRIAGGLGLTLSQLLRLDEQPHVVVVRKADRRVVQRDGHRFEELTPPLPGLRAGVTEHRLEPGSRTSQPGDPPIHAPGSRETAIVGDGRLRLVVGDEHHDLRAGDSVTFDADLPHHFENPGRSVATFVAVVTSGARQ